MATATIAPETNVNAPTHPIAQEIPNGTPGEATADSLWSFMHAK
jgi:hypothetical protein